MNALLRQLPNALTLCNGFAGLGAVVLCVEALLRGAFAEALQHGFLLIALGVVCDTLDGPLARALKANDPLGAQLDSLCDGATFGVATALIAAAAFWSLSPVLAFLLACLWLAAVLLRLARFNLDTDTATAHLYFSGLCSPVAALLLVSVLAASVGTAAFPWLPLSLALLLPVLMLGRLRFADLPKHYLARKRSWLEPAVAAALMVLLSPATGLAIFLGWFVLQSLVAVWCSKAQD